MDALAKCMKNWTLHIIKIESVPVKVYVNSSNTMAIVFPLFGRYYRVNSDVNALDLLTSVLFHTTINDIAYNTITYSAYLNSLEDTAVIDITKVA